MHIIEYQSFYLQKKNTEYLTQIQASLEISKIFNIPWEFDSIKFNTDIVLFFCFIDLMKYLFTISNFIRQMIY